LRPIIKCGFSLFFRRIEVIGQGNIPQNKPVILVANHQNAMIDPVICCSYIPQQLHWLTRADVFKNPAIKRLLTQFNMLPVYRERDRLSDIQERNQEVFNEVYERLKGNAMVCLFPEGTHRGKKQLMPLKKGVVRMATGAVEAGVKDAVILPVGIDYEDYYAYRKTATIVIGTPIPLAQYEASMISDAARAQNLLMQDIRIALKSIMVDIDHDHEYEVWMSLRPLINHLEDDTLEDQFHRYHSILENLATKSDDAAVLQSKGQQWFDLMKDAGLDEALFNPKGYRHVLAVLLGFPFAIIGYLCFYPWYLLVERIQRKLVKDPLFTNSIRIVIWTFFTPLYLIIGWVALTLSPLTWGQALLALGLIAICGRLTLWWNDQAKRFGHWIKVQRFKRTQADAFQQLMTLRSELIAILRSVQSK
jgi:1-acyl-sn-glycerol-3-phosphate acyltransferase